jgi:hypothetical protein
MPLRNFDKLFSRFQEVLDQYTLAESATERQKLIALARQIARERRQLVTTEQEKIKKRRK